MIGDKTTVAEPQSKRYLGRLNKLPWKGSRVRLQVLGVSFVLPAVILLAIFLIVPIVYVVYISFTRWNILGAAQFVGLKNYTFIFHDPSFYHALWTTIYFVAIAVPAQMAVGLFLAVLLNRPMRARGLVRTIFFLPMAVSFVAAGLIFSWMLATTPFSGMIPTLLQHAGLHFPDWQGRDGSWAMIMIIIMNTWKSAGYSMVIYLAGLQSINPAYYEAAQIDGARSEWHLFRYISWPLLQPTTALLLITNTIFTFRAFDPIYVMTQGGPAGASTTLVYYVYEKFPDLMGIASAAATVMLIGVLALSIFQFLMTRQAEAYV